MKKFRHFYLLCFLFLTTALLCSFVSFAEDATEHKVVCSYNDKDKTVTMSLYVSKGTAIVGYCSFDYDSSVLKLLDINGTAVPSPVPAFASDGKSTYLKQVIGAKNGIVINDIGKGADKLIDTSEGFFLFAWYLPEKTAVLDASKGEVAIAEVKFALADGKTYEDIKNNTIAFASAKITDKIGDWKPGLRVLSASKTSYYFDPDSKTNNSVATISYTFDFGENKSETPTENLPADDNNDDNAQEQPTIEETPTKPANEASFGISTTETQNSIKVKWATPDVSEEITSYALTVTDTDGNVVRKISSISPITTSCTIKDIASDYGYIIGMSAVLKSGKEISSEKVNVHTPLTDIAPAIIAYTVIYDAGNGYLYGFEKEEVIFGRSVQKIPDVIPPDGYVFKGWSTDGKTVTDVTTVRIYENTTLKALYMTGVEASAPGRTDKTVYINGYVDGTFRPTGNITRAEIAALFARLCKDYSDEVSFNADFGDIKASDWFINYVGCCVKFGIINGYDGNLFKPKNNVTRGEFAAMLCRLYGFEGSSDKTYFSDVSTHWSKVYVNTLFEKGVINNVESDGKFRPDEYLTRQDAVLMLNAAQGRNPDKSAIDEYVISEGQPFSDVEKSSPAYYDILEAAVEY